MINMKEKLKEFKVKGIALDEDSQMPFIILQDVRRENVLPIDIGPFEASAIIVEMEGVHVPMPLTHDLISQFFKRHKFHLKYVEIYGVANNSYLARLHYKRGINSYTMEVRPSDGIALAIRLGSPIYIQNWIIQKMLNEPYILERVDSKSHEILYLGAQSTSL